MSDHIFFSLYVEVIIFSQNYFKGCVFHFHYLEPLGSVSTVLFLLVSFHLVLSSNKTQSRLFLVLSTILNNIHDHIDIYFNYIVTSILQMRKLMLKDIR